MDLKEELGQTNAELQQTEARTEAILIQEISMRQELNDLTSRLQRLSEDAGELGINIPLPAPLPELQIEELNLLLNETVEGTKSRRLPKLSAVDIMIYSHASFRPFKAFGE